MRTQPSGYVRIPDIINLLFTPSSTEQTSSLKILLSIQKHLSSSLSKTESSSKPQPQFHISHFKKIVHGLLLCPSSSRNQSSNKRAKGESSGSKTDGKVAADVRDVFIENYLSVNDDVRWFFLRESAYVLFCIDYPSILVLTKRILLSETYFRVTPNPNILM